MGPFSQLARVWTGSPEETALLGKAVGQTARSGDVLLLQGELGSGKTCLAQGIALGLGVKDRVSSPSFVLVREYCGRIPMYHMDLYRLDRLTEISELGIDDYLQGDGICVIEWAERGLQLFPLERLQVCITAQSPSARIFDFTAAGEQYTGRLDAIRVAAASLRWNWR